MLRAVTHRALSRRTCPPAIRNPHAFHRDFEGAARARCRSLRLRMETANSFKTRGVASEVCLVAHDSPGCALKAACAEEGFRGGRGGGGYLRGGGEGGQDLEERSTINSLSGCTSRKLLCRMAKLIPLHLQVRPCALRKPSPSSIGLIYAAALSALYSSAPDVP